MINEQGPRVEVMVAEGPHCTVAVAGYDGFIGAGDAKRSPGDKKDQRIGDRLAVGRAFADLSEILLKDANDLSSRLNPEPPEPPHVEFWEMLRTWLPASGKHSR